MQGTNLYLVVFVIAVMLLPSDQKRPFPVLQVLGIVAIFLLLVAFCGGGEFLREWARRDW